MQRKHWLSFFENLPKKTIRFSNAALDIPMHKVALAVT